MKDWGEDRVLIPTRHRRWDEQRVGLGSQPIETSEGWLILYHGARDTASGTLYRVGLALLDLETLELIRRSKEWVFGPKELYERVGNVDDIVFPCGAVIKGNELWDIIALAYKNNSLLVPPKLGVKGHIVA